MTCFDLQDLYHCMLFSRRRRLLLTHDFFVSFSSLLDLHHRFRLEGTTTPHIPSISQKPPKHPTKATNHEVCNCSSPCTLGFRPCFYNNGSRCSSCHNDRFGHDGLVVQWKKERFQRRVTVEECCETIGCARQVFVPKVRWNQRDTNVCITLWYICRLTHCRNLLFVLVIGVIVLLAKFPWRVVEPSLVWPRFPRLPRSNLFRKRAWKFVVRETCGVHEKIYWDSKSTRAYCSWTRRNSVPTTVDRVVVVTVF